VRRESVLPANSTLRGRAVAALAAVLVVTLAGSTAVPAQADTSTYRIVALAPSATSSAATAINAFGTVVGWSASAGAPRATAWFGFATIDVGLPPGDVTSQAYGINNLNKIVGTASRPARPGEQGERVQHGFAWSPRTLRARDIPNGNGATQSTGRAVNDAGTVVGDVTASSGFAAYRRKDGGRITKLARLKGLRNSAALSINRSGDVAGYAYNFNGPRHAIVWRGRTAIDLGKVVAPGRSSEATDVSDTGDVVGTAEGPDGSFHGFLWAAGHVVDLGPADQYDTLRINNHRQVVFTSSDNALWQGGQRIDLKTLVVNSEGWILQGGSDINDAGQIVGTGYKNGDSAAYLLQPSTITQNRS
jgi:probable HAF family extracellular repeat protein